MALTRIAQIKRRLDRQPFGRNFDLLVYWAGVHAVMVGVAQWIEVAASDWYVHFQPRFLSA